jgi:hypothetical protein
VNFLGVFEHRRNIVSFYEFAEEGEYQPATEPDEFGICWQAPVPEGSSRAFAQKVQEYCEAGADDAAYIDLFVSALRGDYDFGSIAQIVLDRYVVQCVTEKAKLERARLKERTERRLAREKVRLAEEFSQRLDQEVELRGIYQIVQDKFRRDPEFLSEALRRIREDVKRSKESGEYPYLYEITLRHCSQDQVVGFLVDEYHDDLLVRFADCIKDRLLESERENVLEMVKSDMRRDESLVAELRNEIKAELIRDMFHED